MTFFFYGRTSTALQRDQATVETQNAGREGYERKHGIEVPSENRFIDDGYSGKIFLQDRPRGGPLLANIRQASQRGERDIYLLVWDLERLSRDAENAIGVTKELLKLDLKIVTIGEGDKVYDNSPDSHYDLGMRAVQGEYDHAKIRRKTMAGRTRCAGEGYFVGGTTAYGYTLKPKQDRRDRSVLTLNGAKIPGFDLSYVDVVRMIYQRMAKGASCQVTADYLNGLGIPAHEEGSGKRRTRIAPFWRPPRIRLLVMNPVYKGDSYWGKRRNETIKGKRVHLHSKPQQEWTHQKVPAIVSAASWEQANRVLRGHNLAAMSHVKNAYLLSGGLIRCGLCERAFIGTGTHYRCVGRHGARQLHKERGQRCMAPSVPRKELESIVMEDILAFLAEPGWVIDTLRTKLQKSEIEDVLGQERVQMEKQRQRLIDQDQILVTSLVKGIITEEDFKRERSRLHAEHQAIERLLADADQHLAVQKSNLVRLQSTEQLLKRLSKQVEKDEDISFEKRRDLVALLVDEIVIAGDGSVDINYQFEDHDKRHKQRSEKLYVPT